MKLVGLACVVAVVSAFTAVGCGGGSEEAQPTPQPAAYKYPDVAAFCNGIANAQCSKTLGDACNIDTAACIPTVQNDCIQGKGEITFGRTVSYYNAKKADACVDAVKAAYGDAKVEAAEFVTINKACDAAFSAGNAAGFACKVDADCDLDAGLSCYLTEVGKGTCQPAGTIGKGDDCGGGGRCQADLYCSPNDKICASGKKEGSPCMPVVQPCENSLLCDNGTCVAKKGKGEACDANEKCASSFCARISASSRQCFDALQYGAGSTLCSSFGAK